ncbi:MAG: MFS transporter [Magnetospirillum sp.]|nr:MFS transporter [Magnetospirillum sp.]
MPKTSWPAVLLFLGAGIVAAFQVGKAPIALPGIRADFGTGLAAVAWVLSTFPMVGALTGAAMGVMVTRIGARTMLPLGLALIAAASLAGALSLTLPWLLATRVAEGLGLLVVVIAAPTLITQVTHGDDRAKAFGMWGCFMPAGMAMAMLAAPLLSGLGWRGLWLGMAVLAAAYAVAVTLRRGPAPAAAPEPAQPLLPDLAATLRAPGPRLLAVVFASYTAAWAVLTGFLPTLLMERMAVSAGTAGLMTAAVAGANVIGNLATGPILAHGPRRWLLVALASGAMGLCSLGIFDPATPGWAAFALSLLFSASGGLLPACVIGGAAAVAPDRRLVPAAVGLVMQGSNLGLTLGPVAAAVVVEPWGWGAARLVLVPAALLGILLALRLRRL